MQELKQSYAIVIVTHNMQQAARVADMTAFFSVDVADEGERTGILVEFDRTDKIFTQPPTSAPRTTSPGDSVTAVPRASFQEELHSLEATLQEESELVLRSLRGAMNALRERDAELADEVIAFDDEVDARYLALEQGIESLLARQTPVAVDLRLVLAILHINLHLERMADLCVTISKLTKLAGPFEGDAQVLESFDGWACARKRWSAWRCGLWRSAIWQPPNRWWTSTS